MSFLQIKQLSKFFANGSTKTSILDNATYLFSQDQTVAITGVSGTGKSTLLHILAGIDTPSSGKIFFGDTDMSLLDCAKRQAFLQKSVGIVLQSACLIDELSVLENIMIKGLIAKESYREVEEKAEKLLQMIGLKDKAYVSPRMLSGGEQQRVALARALFNKPAFILADELTAHLDAVTKNSIMNLLLLAHQQWGLGLILATHDESVAQRMDVVLRLEKGKLLEVSGFHKAGELGNELTNFQ